LQTKLNTKSKTQSCKNSACSRRGVTLQTNAIGFRKCDLGLPSHLSFSEAVTAMTVRELSDTTSYCSCIYTDTQQEMRWDFFPPAPTEAEIQRRLLSIGKRQLLVNKSVNVIQGQSKHTIYALVYFILILSRREQTPRVSSQHQSSSKSDKKKIPYIRIRTPAACVLTNIP
jgi:hypothetical protein